MQFQELRERVTVTIPASGDASSATQLPRGTFPYAIELPAAFEANTARIIVHGTLDAPEAGETPLQPNDQDGTIKAEASITVAATNTNRLVILTPANWYWCNRITLNATQADGSTAVTQTADRTFTVICGP